MYLDKLKLDDRVAVVTGGGRAIGLACVHALAEARAKMVIADVDPDVASAGQAELRKAGYNAAIVVLDVTKPDDVAKVANRLAAEHGRIDILINNAGIARSGTPGENVSDELWLNVNDVNYNGVFWCCRAFGRHMLSAGRGSVVNIGSMSGFIVNRPQEELAESSRAAALEAVVDLHTFDPGTLAGTVRQAGAHGVRTVTEELTAAWFGWPVRTLEYALNRERLGWKWSMFAYKGWLRLSALDRHLSRVVPDQLFYNVSVTGIRPGE
jgi:NAD(P)-dependent dehydrogenase (short-subunit alcohol dehydrogenase family)